MILGRLSTPFVLGSVVGFVLGVIAASAAWSLWNSLIDNPRVTSEARLEYVMKSEVVSLQTKLELEESRRKMAENISKKHSTDLQQALKNNLIEQNEREVEIAEYEARLKSSGRVCFLNGSDIEWMRKP